MGLEQSPATPVVPDLTMVRTVAARKAVEGILAAGHYDSRFDRIGTDAALILARVLRLYACFGRAPLLHEVAVETALSELSVVDRLNHLHARDLVLLDSTSGAIVGAYPFTQAQT